ncbi:YhcN/YlaJ family sporulation lipoprotein [Thermoactinomyces daqus]|uniref:YhcN/YlaJ family sporulation lipoprotein n=1 Tax=Thermoactinomyces daqus TaxID=1329516 RepID=A0A7W1X8P4_9BACL|nr:YhcN/YlaJ family sporulation lipoprotein [Thermoactinomyces daqus]MBA4542121.1 YhcN/YlaJ family sporulation lipoprotein [Thermoactinomyces daqus]
MKRRYLILFAAMLLLIPACNNDDQQQADQGLQQTHEPLYREKDQDSRIGMVRNDEINGEENAHGGGQNEIGYFKYTPENYHQNGRAAGPDVFVDRPLLAKHIAQMVTVLPNVKEATALVTDDHVFLGIKTKNGRMDPKTVKEAKRTAESITPRYFKVHVTENRTLESQINSIGMRMTSDYDVEGIRGDLEQLLREMGDTTPPEVNESSQPNRRSQMNPRQD